MIQSPDLYLSALLKNSGAHLSAEEVISMIPGVLAAPGIDDGIGDANSWITMAAESPTPELVTHLTSLIDRVKDTNKNSLIIPCPSKKRISLLREELSHQDLNGFSFLPAKLVPNN